MEKAREPAPTQSDSAEDNTDIDPFREEPQEIRQFAPERMYPLDGVPEFRVYPIVDSVPDFDVDHPGVGNSLKHYVGQEEVLFAGIEYRSGETAAWLDAHDPGRPAWRSQPPLTPAQAADLSRHRPDLADVPYAEPLVFLAHGGDAGFWARAVAAGWAPTKQDLELLVNARTLLDTDSCVEDERA